MGFFRKNRQWLAMFLIASTFLANAAAQDSSPAQPSPSVYDNLKKLDISLPAVVQPVASYVMYTQSGKFLYLSGHIPKKNGKPWTGQFGKNITVAEGREAARLTAIDLIATLQAAAGGDLNRITRIVKLVVMVNSSTVFTEHHLVANGASDMMVKVFGEKGKHARSAFGVAQLPLGACIEIELIAELD